MLQRIVDGIDRHSGRLLQIVNLNVRGSQYVVAGIILAWLPRSCLMNPRLVDDVMFGVQAS
jgi:hypothetical protein